MKTVNVAKLKAELSAHLQLVKQGEEVLVCERNRPVARLVPIDVKDYSEQEQRLIAQGRLIPPKKKRPKNFSWPDPSGNVSREVMERIWREERGD